jgi:hypothetical protein
VPHVPPSVRGLKKTGEAPTIAFDQFLNIVFAVAKYSNLRLFGSANPSPLMPRWATALNFVIPSVADSDFLHRVTAQGDACGFL